MSKLRDIATRGIAWNAFERFSGQFINLIVGVILARILTPEDFGLLGMLLLFTSVANLFVDSGMGSGLIQQQEKKSIDFSTVFIFNLVVSFLFYFLLFALAPHISAFYEEIRLTALLRILSLNIIIGALTTIQRVKLNISLDFKTLAQINIISTLLSGIIGIYFATVGLGYWSLVLQSISANLFKLFGFLIIQNWRYSLKFSIKSFKKLFGFGSKLLTYLLISG